MPASNTLIPPDTAESPVTWRARPALLGGMDGQSVSLEAAAIATLGADRRVQVKSPIHRRIGEALHVDTYQYLAAPGTPNLLF